MVIAGSSAWCVTGEETATGRSSKSQLTGVRVNEKWKAGSDSDSWCWCDLFWHLHRTFVLIFIHFVVLRWLDLYHYDILILMTDGKNMFVYLALRELCLELLCKLWLYPGRKRRVGVGGWWWSSYCKGREEEQQGDSSSSPGIWTKTKLLLYDSLWWLLHIIRCTTELLSRRWPLPSLEPKSGRLKQIRLAED